MKHKIINAIMLLMNGGGQIIYQVDTSAYWYIDCWERRLVRA